MKLINNPLMKIIMLFVVSLFLAIILFPAFRAKPGNIKEKETVILLKNIRIYFKTKLQDDEFISVDDHGVIVDKLFIRSEVLSDFLKNAKFNEYDHIIDAWGNPLNIIEINGDLYLQSFGRNEVNDFGNGDDIIVKLR